MNPSDAPEFVHPAAVRIPISDHVGSMMDIPQSRMFLIKGSLAKYQDKHPDRPIYDASQGDGGASLPGVPQQILERAAELQIKRGTAYDLPFGTAEFRRAVVEDYWSLDSDTGFGPQNVAAAVGGRDALVKAYAAMLALGHGRQGDVLLVSRVPWISYNWGPYGIGANVLLAPGRPAEGWAYTPEGIQESVEFAARSGRKIAGMILTSPDNPTGRTLTLAQQADLARVALEAGIAFVLFDWIYHTVTDQSPYDLNAMLRQFSPAERERLIFLDGITKSLGGSNIRNAHLIASDAFIKFIVARASHTVIPSFFSTAVAMAAYEMGFSRASRTIVEPTNASRQVLRAELEGSGLQFVLGKGYYAFIHVGQALRAAGWPDSVPLGEYLASQHGVAVVPGAFSSAHGGDWVRFSYALPAERTRAAFTRLLSGLQAVQSGEPAHHERQADVR